MKDNAQPNANPVHDNFSGLLNIRLNYQGDHPALSESLNNYNAAVMRAYRKASENPQRLKNYLTILRNSLISCIGDICVLDQQWYQTNVERLSSVLDAMQHMAIQEKLESSQAFEERHDLLAAIKYRNRQGKQDSVPEQKDYVDYVFEEFVNATRDNYKGLRNTIFHPIDTLKSTAAGVATLVTSPVQSTKAILNNACKRPWYTFFSLGESALLSYGINKGVGKVFDVAKKSEKVKQILDKAKELLGPAALLEEQMAKNAQE